MDKIMMKALIVFFCNISVVLLLITNTSAADSKCSASNNEKWNKNKQKCVPCWDCPPGHYRNLTEPYTRRKGLNGDEQCLQCRSCPEGFYSENGHGECIKCRVNCTEMKREYDEFCSSVQDAKCGSCLSGYEDAFGHTLFPCSPKKSARLLKPTDPVRDRRHNDEDSSKGDSQTAIPEGVVGVICAAVVVVAILSTLVTSIRYIRKRNTTTQDSTSTHQGIYNRVDDLSRDDDVEIDASRGEETVPKQFKAISQMDDTAVRSELASVLRVSPRPELSQPASTQPDDGILYLRLSQGTDVVCFERKKDICKCRTEMRCRCKSYHFPTHKIEKSDDYISVVASEICHDPLSLFQNLGLDAPIIYQENDTRNRAPERISQKEFVIRLLHRWIEVESGPTTLQRLSVALCDAGFHSINNKLYNVCLNPVRLCFVNVNNYESTV